MPGTIGLQGSRGPSTPKCNSNHSAPKCNDSPQHSQMECFTSAPKCNDSPQHFQMECFTSAPKCNNSPQHSQVRCYITVLQSAMHHTALHPTPSAPSPYFNLEACKEEEFGQLRAEAPSRTHPCDSCTLPHIRCCAAPFLAAAMPLLAAGAVLLWASKSCGDCQEVLCA